MSKLRPRDELEQELNIQISLGTITSLEDAIEKGLLPALEYGAQMLFDNVRLQVAQYEALPDYIAQYLTNDRTEKVSYAVYYNHFDKLTPEQKEEFFIKASNSLQDNSYHPYDSSYTRYKTACTNIFDIALKNLDEATAIRSLIDTRLINKYEPNFEYVFPLENLRKLPNLLKSVYEHYNRPIIKIFHPDVEIRKEVLNKILSKDHVTIKVLEEKCKHEYSTGRSHQYRTSKTEYATESQKLFVNDPDIGVREILVNKTTIIKILELVIEKETDYNLKQVAERKLIKLKTRTSYSRKYNERKKNKLVTNSQNV